MASNLGRFAIFCLLILSLLSAGARAADVEPSAADRAAMNAATAALCGKAVVLLGEASHGDGHSDAFKVALIRRLVSECGFNAVLFEASFYEFLPVSRAARQGRPIAADSVATAVGGLWKFDQEVQPLFSFLADRVNIAGLEVGGLDFQLGGVQQPYANDLMFVELAAALPTTRQDDCNAAFHSHVYGDALRDGSSAAARDQRLTQCLVDIQAALPDATADPSERADQQQMVANLLDLLAHGSSPPATYIQARDRMMAENLFWFIDHRKRGRPLKILVWTHNAHAARNSRAMADYRESENLGTALARRFGTAMSAVGVTACAGEFRWSRASNRAIPETPANALEARYCADQATPSSTWVDAQALKAAGITSAGLFGHVYKEADWGLLFDAALILDRERAPTRAKQ